MASETQWMVLSELAQKYAVSESVALGLGSGLYFEYFRRPHQTPTRFITGLHREMEKTLSNRLSTYQTDPSATLLEALHENALWFNLDRAPTNGLLGMEMLAEELPGFESLPDRISCVTEIAATIQATRGLYRQTYADFLAESAVLLPAAEKLALALCEIAQEWLECAAQLAGTENDPSQLERAGRLVRRLAFREEHFWGSVLEIKLQ